MLGLENEPLLLVSVADKYNPTDFEFRVINGEWTGRFTKGRISINYTGYSEIDPWASGPPPWTSLTELKILTDNQDRLQGSYQDVFNNF